MKMDISKAYDRIEWGFLVAVLRRFGFSEIWVPRVASTTNIFPFLLMGFHMVTSKEQGV